MNIDDSIGLCMFFGLICNGASALLATVWKCSHQLRDKGLNWLHRKSHKTKLFDLLLKMNRVMYNPNREKDLSLLYGNCKLPRFQYPNHSLGIVQNSLMIHDTV
jgi:hypothetical protein